MAHLSAYEQGFLSEFAELEKEAAKATKKIEKETRKGWSSSSSRKGRRPMRVETMLKKEKAGTLGGYKLAHVIEALGKVAEKERIVMYGFPDDPSKTKPERKPGEMPSRDDVHYEQAKRTDATVDAATVATK